MKEDDVLGFAKALVNAKRDLAYCSVCGHITDRDPCYICNDSHRDQSVVCVVQEPKDVIAMEKMKRVSRCISCVTWCYLSNGGGPEDINIPQLLKRLHDETVQEVILATNPNIEGSYSDVYIPPLKADRY